MNIFYCDLCGIPFKDSDSIISLQIAIMPKVPKNTMNDQDYYNYINSITKDTKEICPTCKHIFDEIFKLRKDNLKLLELELLGYYDLNIKKRKDI